MRTPSDQTAADARGILEAISDFRSDGDHEKADQAIASVMNLPTSALHTIIDVAAALAVTVRDWREEGQ